MTTATMQEQVKSAIMAMASNQWFTASDVAARIEHGTDVQVAEAQKQLMALEDREIRGRMLIANSKRLKFQWDAE